MYCIENQIGGNNIKLQKITYYENKLKKINTVFECPITLETVSSGFKTKCGHLFSNALLLINDSKCPCCRSELC